MALGNKPNFKIHIKVIVLPIHVCDVPTKLGAELLSAYIEMFLVHSFYQLLNLFDKSMRLPFCTSPCFYQVFICH